MTVKDPSSKAGAAAPWLDLETTAIVAESLETRWAEHMNSGDRLRVESARLGDSVSIRFAVVSGKLEFFIEAAVSGVRAQGPVPDATRDLLLDALDALLGIYLTEGRGDLPRSWTPMEYEGHTVSVQAHQRNNALEQAADALLGE